MAIGLAVVSQDRARNIAVRVVELFERDPPPPPIHEEKTWELLAPGCVFRVQLDMFIGGVPRWACSIAFKMQICIFRMAPAAETTIEEKHSRTAQELKRHHIGPVRASVSNRMPLFERTICRRPEVIEDVVKCMDQTRQFNSCLALFNFEGHPAESAAKTSYSTNVLKTWQCIPMLSFASKPDGSRIPNSTFKK